MKGAWSFAVFLVVAAEAGAQPPGPGQDPLAQHVFAPDLVMRYSAEIGLDEKQRAAIKDEVIKMQSRFLDLQWEVQAEIAEKYYARIALEPKRYDFAVGDTLYVPQNTVAQYFSADTEPVRLLSGQNRVFKQLGYDSVAYLDDAEYLADTADNG